MVAMHLTSAEAAHRLGIAKRTLYRAVKRGEIVPALRSPGGWLRFLDSDIIAGA
jgi:excisionase family DNA binding protein